MATQSREQEPPVRESVAWELVEWQLGAVWLGAGRLELMQPGLVLPVVLPLTALRGRSVVQVLPERVSLVLLLVLPPVYWVVRFPKRHRFPFWGAYPSLRLFRCRRKPSQRQ